MNPNACWQRFLDATAEDDTVEAYHALNDLSDWLLRRGFLPDAINDPNTVYNLLVVHGLACKQLKLSVE